MPASDDLSHGWVSTNCGRGTSDILWSCLATIFLSVYTAIHLPVPLYHEQQPPSMRQKLIRSGIGPALISVVAPEFLTITAVRELATSLLRKKEIRGLTHMNWTLTQQFFLDMGGICLRSPLKTDLQIGGKEVIRAIKASRDSDKRTIDLPDWVSELGKLTEDQIKDHAKSDTLSKTIACGQALWLVTQVVSRLIQHQAITLLEVSTCAYVVCALLSYFSWWRKPQGCLSPIFITCSDNAMSDFMRDYDKYYYSSEDNIWKHSVWVGRKWCRSFDDDYHLNVLSSIVLSTGLFGLCPTLFGAIHVASWNVRLPSDVELWMWRASSIYCLIAGVIAVISLEAVNIDDLYLSSQRVETFIFGLFLLYSTVYIIVRIFMIVEVFISLRALPPSAFESVQWSSFIPHV